MRQSGRLKHHAIRLRAPQMHWSMILLGISIGGTLLVTGFLIFDGWIDALAIYIVSGLMLALLLCRLVGQQGGPHGDGSVNQGRNRSGIFRSHSILSRSSLVRPEPARRTSRPDVAIAPSVLNKVASTD